MVSLMPTSLQDALRGAIGRGKAIEADPGQLEMLAGQLSALAHRLEERRLARKSSSLGWLFASANWPARR